MDFIEFIKNWRNRKASEKLCRHQEDQLSLEIMETEAKILKLTFKEMKEQYEEQRKRRGLKPAYVS